MPRYFYDLADGSREVDDTGIDLPNVSEARVAAIRFLGEVLTHEPSRLDDGSLRVLVRNDGADATIVVAALIEQGPA